MALGYKVALTNVWWNRGGQDVRLFQNTTEQQTYFAGLGLYWNELNNFNLNDNITTTIIFKDKSGRDAETLLKCNYAIVWNTIKNTYRYYFIAEIKQDSANQMQVALDLDDVNTNLVPNIANVGNVLVKRWTGLNYVKNNSNNLVYDFTQTKQSFLSQGDSPTLRNIATNNIKILQYGDEKLDNWLDENVRYWKYVYLVENQGVVAWAFNDPSFVQATEGRCYNKVNSSDISMSTLPYQSLAVPYYTGNKKIYIRYEISGVSHYLLLDSLALSELVNIQGYIAGSGTLHNNNPLGTYGIEEKMSNISPLYISSYSINANGHLIINATYNTAIPTEHKVSSGGYSNFYLTEADNTNNTSEATASRCIEMGFYQKGCNYFAVGSHDLDTDSTSPTNVKKFSKEYSLIRVRLGNQSYDYDPQKIITNANVKSLFFRYTEVLKVGVSKVYLRLWTTNLYTYYQAHDFTGLIASIDLTEPLLTNQWADYLASHKNYYMQTAFNNTIGLTSGLSKSFVSNNSLMAGQKAFDTTLNYTSSIINQEYDKDNMQQAPDSLSNANGDPYFINAVSGIKPVIDTITTIPRQMDSILDNWKRNGIIYEQIMSLSDVIMSHKSYDSLSCIIDKVGNISTKEFIRLKDYMSSVRRYWHTDTETTNEYILTP